jgi:SAM-dependent methyltransferase
MTPARVSPSWLALREPADAAARAGTLVDEIRNRLPADRPLVIYDLGCGTGATLRWLAPQLPGPQHWIGYDVDADLLATVNAAPGLVAADGLPVTIETRRRDVTRLDRSDLADATLITSSALLDLLTAEELDRLVCACASARCPVLITLTVTGAVQLWPRHPLDGLVAAAFNSHQRRTVDGRRLLGPAAADLAGRRFTELGRDVMWNASPWRLGPARRELTYAWLAGWLAAAWEQDRRLASDTRSYARVRLADASAGRLHVRVHHRDLLVRPVPRGPREPDVDRPRFRSQ